jgi:hypothetical protein
MQKAIFKKTGLIILVDIFLYLLLPLKFGNLESRYIICPLVWISVGIIGKEIIPKNKSILKTILVLLGIAGYILMTCLFIFFFFLFCTSVNYGTVYQNKNEHSLKLVCRSYECYGTSDDCDLYEERELLPNIYWVTKFTDKIDPKVWTDTPPGISGGE